VGEHVVAHIEQAVKSGAVVVAGGAGHERLFVRPTVLTGVTDDMAIARDETFGPVACVSVVDDENEAIRRANDTRFGLGAAVFGSDPKRTERVARSLAAGMVGINQSPSGARGTPWVGARESGFSFHSSVEGHRNFTQTRVVSRPRQ
jgi:acyl-CoA reductase-like NAD-dependent aldehyde dehydrogenase